MKKVIMTLLIVVALFSIMVSTVFAGGGQVRGDGGAGSVNQVQKMDPPPFQP